MTRKELHALSELRHAEAKSLLRAGHPEGAYYLAGYAVECAIKACIAKETVRHQFPDLPKAQSSWKHDLVELVKTAGLSTHLRHEEDADSRFASDWTIVRQWSEKARYERISHVRADAIVQALPTVLKWLRRHW